MLAPLAALRSNVRQSLAARRTAIMPRDTVPRAQNFPKTAPQDLPRRASNLGIGFAAAHEGQPILGKETERNRHADTCAALCGVTNNAAAHMANIYGQHTPRSRGS